jgi:hypothetical protein
VEHKAIVVLEGDQTGQELLGEPLRVLVEVWSELA